MLCVGLSPEQPVLQLILGCVHVAVQPPALQPVQGEQGVSQAPHGLLEADLSQ